MGDKKFLARTAPLKVPAGGHPIVRRVFEEMNRQRKTLREVAELSGVSADSIAHWRISNNPRLDLAEAVLNVLGLRVGILPLEEGQKK